jgi:hypothetical protein
MSSARLLDLCSLIRSKNAGPFELTFDFVCRDEAGYRELRDSGLLTPALFANLFSLGADQVGFHAHDAALAIKVTIPRPTVQGSLDDADCYGGQQYALVLDALDRERSDSVAHAVPPAGSVRVSS